MHLSFPLSRLNTTLFIVLCSWIGFLNKVVFSKLYFIGYRKDAVLPFGVQPMHCCATTVGDWLQGWLKRLGIKYLHSLYISRLNRRAIQCSNNLIETVSGECETQNIAWTTVVPEAYTSQSEYLHPLLIQRVLFWEKTCEKDVFQRKENTVWSSSS